MIGVRFTVVGQPEPAGSKKAFVNKHTGRAAVVDANPRAKGWKSRVTDEAMAAMDGQPLLDGALFVQLTFVVPRPKGHFGKKGLLPSAPEFPTVRPDVLKLARGVEDAMSGVVYRDDAQIVRELLCKFYGEPARCEVRVSFAVNAVAALELAA